MRKLVTHLVVYLAVLAASLLAVPLSAHAAPPGAEITLSPAKTTLADKLQPNTLYRETFTMINSGTAPATVHLWATPYSVQNERYTPDYSTHNDYNQLSRWITFQQPSYHLKPGQTVTVPYTITTPASLPAGDQYAMLMAEMTNDQSAATGNSVQTKSRVGIKLLAHTVGQTTAKTTVQLPHLPLVIASQRYDFPLTFHNQGNVDFEGTYHITVTSIFNDTPVYEKTRTVQVLPETKRALQIPWSIQQNIGLYRIEVSAETTHGVVKTTRTVLAMTTLGMIALLVLLVIIISGSTHMILRHRHTHTRFRKRR